LGRWSSDGPLDIHHFGLSDHYCSHPGRYDTDGSRGLDCLGMAGLRGVADPGRGTGDPSVCVGGEADGTDAKTGGTHSV
jgi:hypothetical protein